MKRIRYHYPKAAFYLTSGVMLSHIVIQPSPRIVLIGRVLWALAVLWSLGAILWNAWAATYE